MRKAINISILLLSPLVAYDLPIYKTGITVSEVAGDDGDTQRGISRELTRDDSLEVVIDSRAKLMWQDSASHSDNLYDWSEAISHCEALDFAGYSDWRLPSRMELKSIVEYSRV